MHKGQFKKGNTQSISGGYSRWKGISKKKRKEMMALVAKGRVK